MLLDISPEGMAQQSLFDSGIEQSAKSAAIMATLDGLNQRFGRGTLFLAAAGTLKRWEPRAEMRTPRYTTCWNELPTVR